MAEINFELEERTTKVELPENLIFGRTFTDHVFEMDYDEALGGWHSPTIKKYSNLHNIFINIEIISSYNL